MAFSSLDIQAMAEKYPLSITAETKSQVAQIRISGTIYGWDNLAQTVSSSIDGFLSEGIVDVHVYINSPGGDVFTAAEIINQLNRFTGRKTGTGGAIVASAATAIAIELDEFEMAENGQWMYHKPSGYLSGNEDKIESSLKLLKDLTKHYKSRYASKTGMTEDEIEANWAKGDVWLTAKEAHEQKFISSVSKASKITSEIQALITACGAPIIPTKTETPKKENMNRNAMIAMLKLPADATDEQIEAAVKASVEKAQKVDSMEASAKESKKNQVTEYVDGLIMSKKATADQKENLIKMGMNDFDALKAFGDSLQSVEKPKLDPGAQSEEAARANWTMEDYQEKDPKALTVLMIEDPEKFKKLEEAYFNKK